MDRWGIIKSCTDDSLCKQQTEPVNESNDLSAIEYELVPPADDKNSKSHQNNKPDNRGGNKSRSHNPPKAHT